MGRSRSQAMALLLCSLLLGNSQAFQTSAYHIPSRTAAIQQTMQFKTAPTLVASNIRYEPRSSRKYMSSASVDDSSPSSTYTKKDVANVMFGIIKAMLGTGLLAMPSGLAAITDYPSGLIPANILCATLGILSGYTFSLYGRLTHATQAKSIGELWSKVQSSNGKKDSGKIVSVASLVYCFGCALTFSLVIGSSLSSLLRGTRFTANALPAWALTRQASILGVTSLALFPLCNLSSLAALAPISILGVVGTFVTVLFMGWRCPAIFPNSPYAVPFSGMLANVPSHLQPSFCTYSQILSPAPLVLIAMGCVALMAHFSAPEFYHELASKTKPDVTTGKPNDKPLKDFNIVTVLSYTAVVVINALSMAFGFLTFGSNCDGMILNNYSNLDLGASLSRLLVTISVIGAYPFVIVSGRSAALQLFSPNQTITKSRELRTTSILLGLATAIAMVVRDVGFVVSFNGALMGSNIIYTFPSLLFLKHTSSGTTLTRRLRLERWLCRGLVGFGIVAALIGGATSVIASFFPHLL